MFSERDKDYFDKRYREELRRAESVDDQGLRALHARWAELYRRRLAAMLRQR